MMRRIVGMVLVLVVVAACGGGTASPTTAGMNDAAAAQAEADAALRDTPVPPGADVAVTIDDVSASYETGYGRSAVQGLAICAWFRYWLAGIEADDQDQIGDSSEAAKLMSNWDIYVVADQSFRDVIDGVVVKANLGDPAPMAQFVENNCATAG